MPLSIEEYLRADLLVEWLSSLARKEHGEFAFHTLCTEPYSLSGIELVSSLSRFNALRRRFSHQTDYILWIRF